MASAKWWIAGLAIIVAAGGAGGYWWLNKEDKQLAPSYSTTQVRKGTIEVKVSGTGSIQAAGKETIKATSTGKVEQVNFKQGDKVKQGDVLITFEQEDRTSQIRSKKIDLQKKQLELTDLQNKYKTADEDSRASMVLSIEKQKLDIEAAQDELADLQAGDEIKPIVAPIDGTLTEFDVAKGDTISPNGDLGVIVNLDQMHIVVGVDELDIPKVELQQQAQILVDALPDRTFTGKVVSIADEGSSSNGVASFDVTVLLDEITELKVGMSAQADIMTASKSNVLMLPIDAVQSARGSYYVMVPGTGETTGQAAGGTSSGTEAPGTQQQGQGSRPVRGEQQQGTQQQGGQEQGTPPQGTPPQVGQGSQSGGGNGTRGGFGGGGGGQFPNLSEEERAALREQFANGGGFPDPGGMPGMTATTSGTTTATTTSRVNVEVGLNNEDYIEIVSGLQEGDIVVLPTVTGTSSSNNQQMNFGGFGGGGAGFISGGGGAFPGGGGAFPGGGGTGGGARSGGGAGGGNFGGGGGR